MLHSFCGIQCEEEGHGQAVLCKSDDCAKVTNPDRRLVTTVRQVRQLAEESNPEWWKGFMESQEE